jgi:N-carbamoyl-L-amino-acid hydrolase
MTTATTEDLDVDQDYETEVLEELATFNDSELPAVTRILYTETDLNAKAFMKDEMRSAGLSVREDAVGNIFGRWEGTDPDRPAVATGSHIDAIPESGRFDGTAGVVAGLEAIRALKKKGFEPERSIDLIVFAAEEPTRFGMSCVGSRMLTGAIEAEGLKALEDSDGRPFEEVRSAAGYTDPIEDVKLPDEAYEYFVELHIEQGPILEEKGIPIGVVDSIAAPATLEITLTGDGGHAGAVLMKNRNDAFLAASEVALAVEDAVKTIGEEDTVGTTGICEVYPGAVNSIPSEVRLEVDVRDIIEDRRDQVLQRIQEEIDRIANDRGVGKDVEILNNDPPVQSDAAIKEQIRSVADRFNYETNTMISRAYHDSLFMARQFPTGMIFIPCRDGISHHPDEYTSPEQIRKGTEVLAGTLAELSLD